MTSNSQMASTKQKPPRRAGITEDFESSTGLWIAADTPAEATAWGERVAEALHRQVNHDPAADWAGAGHFCRVEGSLAASGWACLDFFQRVRVGEMPPLDGHGCICSVASTGTQPMTLASPAGVAMA